ncbi:NAD(P)H-dependent oxidoreductase subunit E [Crateriforma conspicua]|uniref:NADP-reducing hydrogenase subunit HndC n=1 Tax=Crateriforma conspicua TaxID=2527996 RepID=A0A5C5Y5X8_9PLAN|nr:NAD(P)H-dependent oxidoreductase subunit E [Crateriforma conspicua]QDV65225.1 NADP-reducing hydrogenase subunit HndC [Crateriforma conspicua]TWT70620.1 NADP-reducing hydrogenase subunit HndC [Crateriforma conspicua]
MSAVVKETVGADSPTTDVDLTFVDDAVRRIGRTPDAVVPLLQSIQKHYRYLPSSALERVCELTDITPASIAGVSTFYTQFRHRPMGRHHVQVCCGTACHVKGADLLIETLRTDLRMDPTQDTDPNQQFTIEPVACLGCCTLAPVVQVDDQVFGRLAPAEVAKKVRSVDTRVSGPKTSIAMPRRMPEGAGEIRVGLGSCCVAQGSRRVFDKAAATASELGVDAKVKSVGCVGMCHQTPLLEVCKRDGTTETFARVVESDVDRILRSSFPRKSWISRFASAANHLLDVVYEGQPPSDDATTPLETECGPVCDFLGPQKRIATENSGAIDPLDLAEYKRFGGFQSLRRCAHERLPQEIIDQIRVSGLRGRGGGGFPSAAKWQIVSDTQSDQKYVICNGDEGDPGAFMDRMLLESFPYRVIEGLAIAALAVGARQGYFYIRAEYPLAVTRIGEAIERCKEAKILGPNILGSNHSLEFDIKEGAGAFICGEETALIHSIEGGRGTPRLRPPYPAQSGLWKKPTLINNVETLAMVPWILRHGGEQYASVGTPSSKGTKVFALTGKVQRGGLIEVPMGITIREIVNSIGGGVPEGRTFKAVQVGGPSGGCIPAELADTPVDYEALRGVGAIMGSGGLVVLDDTDCMVDIARYFLRFTQDQSCGKCTYCRVGTKRLLEILDRMCEGKGKKADLATLESLCESVSQGSLCGLGKTAPNPVLSTLKYFRDEYEAHLRGVCPSGRCKNLISYQVQDNCIGCTLCSQQCPVDAIPMTPYRIHSIDDSRCTRCDACRTICPEDAIRIVSGPKGESR